MRWLHSFSIALVLVLASTVHAQDSVPPSWLELAGSGSGDGISGAPNSYSPSLAINSSGEPVVAWTQTTATGTWIYVRRWNGTAWVEFGGSGSGSGIWAGAETTSSSGAPCIALDGSGYPTVTWRDSGNGNWEVHLVRWNGSAWQELGGSASSGGISNFAGISGGGEVAVTSAGNPCVAWDESEGIHVRRWTGSAWESLSGLSAAYVATGYVSGHSLRLDSSGQPVLSWSQQLSGASPGNSPTSELRVKRWNGSAWVSFDGSVNGNGISGVYNSNPTATAMVLDGSGYPVVTWHAGGPADIYVRRWNGSSWIELGGSGSGYGISPVGAWSYNPSIALTPAGYPVVSWSQQDVIAGNYDVYVLRWNGIAWVELDGSASGGGISATEGVNSSSSNIAVTSGGSIYVTWNEVSAGGYLRHRPPTCVEDLSQFHPDGATAIPIGGYANLGSAVLRGTPVSIVPSGQLRMEVEVQPVGIAFTGTPTAESALVDSGTPVDILVENITGGAWHWRARTMSAGGIATAWIVYGANTEGDADFVVPGTVIIHEPASPSDGGGGGGGGGGGVGCGLLGLEAAVFILLLRAAIRKLRA